MKSIFTILASILCAGSPLIAQSPPSESTEVVQQVNSFQTGSRVVNQARADLMAGKYQEFLQEMDKDYATAKKESELEGLIEIRKETAKVHILPEFASAHKAIQQEKNQNLLNAVKEAENGDFVQKVRSAAGSSVLDDPLSSFYGKAPGAGKNGDENRLIDIDLEYYYKSIHLDSFVASGGSMPDRRERQIVLSMEKMDRMLTASRSFEDKALKKVVEKAAGGVDQRLAQIYDMGDLIALARGKIKPGTALEAKVATIVSNAQGDLAELHRQLLNSLD